MMKNIIRLLPLWLLALAVSSCGETEEADRFANWESRNVAFMDSIAYAYELQQASAEDIPEAEKLYRFKDEVTDLWIYVKKNPDFVATGTEKPLFTSRISAFYRMKYINGDLIQQNYSGTYPSEFDNPTEFTLNEGIISGWAYSVTEMCEGELWTLYIPAKSAYGEAETVQSSSIEPNSALIYDVMLDKIVER